jgi:TPR repeat protein
MSKTAHFVIASLLMALPMLAMGGDFEDGLKAYNSAAYDTAISVWKGPAEAGDAGCQFGMGQLYSNGFGVDMDDAQALSWYGLAAAQGHAQAQYRLAIMHQNGWGVPQSDEEARNWYLMAAEQGHVQSQVALGRIFEMDYSPMYDPVEAYKWFSLAAMLGDAGALEWKEAIAGKLTADQVATANAEIEVWAGDNESMFASH